MLCLQALSCTHHAFSTWIWRRIDEENKCSAK